jgi:diguanylate cyclase (GGDEF)-like protein/PAS domain S-box-containing protein
MQTTDTVLRKPPPEARRTPRYLAFGVFYALVWIGCWYSAGILDRFGVASLWFLPAGLRFALMLALGWPGVALEFATQSALALLQANPWFGTPFGEIFSWPTFWRLYDYYSGAALTAAVVLPLRRWLRGPIDFCEPAHTVGFLAAALFVCTLNALAGTWGVVQLGNVAASDFAEIWPAWLIGDFVAIVTLTPLLLTRTWPHLNRYLVRGALRRRPNAQRAPANDRDTALVAALSLVLLYGIGRSLDVNPHFPLVTLLLLLPVAGVALRFGLRNALFAVALLDAGLVVLLALFKQDGSALQYQIVMIAIAFCGLWLGAMADVRRRLINRYRDFASVSNDVLWETDAEGRLREIGGRLAKQIGLSPGQSWRTLLSPLPQTQLAEIERAAAHREPFRQLELALQVAGGETLWLQISGLPLADENGTPAGYRGTAVDVTRQRAAEALLRDYNTTLRTEVAERTSELHRSHAALLAKERHLEVVLAAVPVGIVELDAEQRCRYINANGCALTGRTLAEAIDSPFLDFVHPDERAHVDFVWRINRQRNDVHWLEFRLDRTDLRCTAHWIRMPDADDAMPGGAMVVLANATARSQQDERLWTLAHHDALTDLPNRNLFWDRARQALLHARRAERSAAVLSIDLDGFKAVNDQLGHAAGDALLREVAQRLTRRMRTSDTVARIGGDEFAVVMPDIDSADDAQAAAKALLASLAAPFRLPQGPAQISASIGVALFPRHAQTAETLTQCADAAMYIAKNRGKNQMHLAADTDAVGHV